MDDRIDLWGSPEAEEVYMIAGWRQWADAGELSSGYPQYLIKHTGARKIGEIRTDDFYVFQIPGTHHFLRPTIKLKDGYRQTLEEYRNELYYASIGEKGLAIFLGDEPHVDADKYADAFFDLAEAVGARRVGLVGGVYGSMPYDKDRAVSCSYSLPQLKPELEKYAVRFSNYEGGASIGSYFAALAEPRGIELVTFYAFVPAYDFSQVSESFQGIAIENDFRAWYEISRRFKHMFDLDLDLSELQNLSDGLSASIDKKIDGIEERMPGLDVQAFIREASADFVEQPFMPLDDIWAAELGDIFDDLDD